MSALPGMAGARPFVLTACLLLLLGCRGAGDPTPTAGATRPSTSVARSSLTCQLQVPAHVGLAEPVVPVTFTLHNQGAATVQVLARHTPLEGMLGDMFAVTRAGQPLEYRGRMVKRGPPEPSEFIELAPGDHLRATIDLLEGYDLTQAGEYAARFTGGEGYACNEVLLTRD